MPYRCIVRETRTIKLMTEQNFLTQRRRQIIALVVSLFVCIGANAQQIKLNFTSTPLKSVLKELHVQSGYSFAYSNDLKQVNNKVIVPSEEEIERNPRSRSAKLRIAEKL